jgi:hypothetical protein
MCFPVNSRALPGLLSHWAAEVLRRHFPRWRRHYLRSMRFFEAKDWIDRVPGMAWVVAVGIVTVVVVAVGVALVAGGLWLTDWPGWKT